MVEAVRTGASKRAVARAFHVSLATVQWWLARADGLSVEVVDWSDRSRRPGRLTRTRPDLEDLVIEVRTGLREQSVLGEYGAAAIRRELDARGVRPLPSLRTIGRILERRGALDARRRVRHRPPPPGWYLPPVAARAVELDSFDVIERIRLLGGQDLDVLTGVSLHGGLIGIWPEIGLTAVKTVAQLETHWRAVGLPGYVQFDNDTRFIGGHGHPDSIGPVIRLCLALRVVPVFVAPRETGFQAAVEALNGRWERKVWARFWMPTLEATRARSDAYVAESRRRHAVRIDAAPPRTPCSAEAPDLRRPPSGRLAFIRRTSDAGAISVLGRSYPVDPRWVHRLVRAELDLDLRRLQFFALRRADPDAQPLLAEIEYVPPARWFR
jgi:putative transposase